MYKTNLEFDLNLENSSIFTKFINSTKITVFRNSTQGNLTEGVSISITHTLVESAYIFLNGDFLLYKQNMGLYFWNLLIGRNTNTDTSLLSIQLENQHLYLDSKNSPESLNSTRGIYLLIISADVH